MTDSPQTNSDGAPFSMDPASFSKLFLVGPHMQAAMITKALERQHEVLNFLDQRCQAELALAQAVRDAASLTEIYSAWTGYARNAIADYSAQLSSAAEHGARDAFDVAKATSEGAAKAAMSEMRVAA